MVGMYIFNPRFSRLTLAYFEDSGWYKANYTMASTLQYGKKKN
jgi:leishmanolysin-like peptidase